MKIKKQRFMLDNDEIQALNLCVLNKEREKLAEASMVTVYHNVYLCERKNLCIHQMGKQQ